MKPGPDPTTIFRIARHYYQSGLSQDDIARLEGFSRSQVSRLIEKARTMGMVRIELIPPGGSGLEELAADLEGALGLGKILIAPAGASRSPDGAMIARSLATAALDFIAGSLIAPGVIGVGWGRSVYALSSQLPYQEARGDRHFVPLIGISGDDEPSLQINTIIDRLSSRFRGRGHFVNTPAVLERGSTRTRIEEERIAALRELWNSVGTAIIGLGDPPNPASRYLEEFPAAYRELLYSSGAVGDILGQFFLADGRPVAFAEGFEHLAFGIGRLPGLSRVICIAGGPAKAEGIAAAARSGYLTDLITDEATARRLSTLLEAEKRRKEA